MAEASQIIDSSIPISPPPGHEGKRIGIFMFGLLLVSYILMAADRYLFPVLAADIRNTFGFSLSNTGLLSTVFTLGIGVAGLPTGYLLTRYRRKTILLCGIVIFSSATALTTIASGFLSMLVCLAVQGVGMSMLATSLFALAANYFSANRAAAVGSVNVCYGIGGIIGPLFAGILRTGYATWHAPMIFFGGFGLAIAVLIFVFVRPWLSEVQQAKKTMLDAQGAASLMNRNTIILTTLSFLYGLSVYGFLGLYPTFLRENLHYSAADAGTVISFFGIGSLASVFGGWLGDRFSPKTVLSICMLFVAVLGYLFFLPSFGIYAREGLTFCYGVMGSSILYVNLAGYHMKALRRTLSGRGSGMFVSSLYAGAAFGGYLLGSLATSIGWVHASQIQISLLSLIGAGLSLGIQRDRMSA